ncbi:cytochrome c3 family protein [Thermosulfuriphilus ammonigenes]|uniref:Cytochrome c3 family protein n=1 Tax=Thermosulfuriphilus ammonigenes TaxID=1936021 RepID=A0A6G7PWZ2_9BACT|nr:cytochrome c3 family protein [Thermosulfuriphilus ammonigenes]MBA2849697.1 c(7)-type cytochrome triheme protein [Thermosulfuriphilus ammonigenes]QIJ72209.1 cytochrome c3 family protein [Thermosulfuriphilus ammonigenes]
MKRFSTGAVLLFFLICGLLLGVGQAEAQEEEHGGVIIFTKPVKAVVFDHQKHMDQGLSCDDCHEGLFEMAAGTAEESGDFTMKSLYEGKYCGACHNGEMAFASNTKCTSCHIGVRGYNRLMGKKEGTGHEEGHH